MDRRLACVVALAALCACRDIVNFDASSASADKALVLPFAPEQDSLATCTQCAMQHCSSERDACLADARCHGLLECYTRCSDPACTAHCGSYATSDTPIESSVYQLDRTDESERYALYYECVAEASCRVECGLGLDWSCLDRKTYRWPTRPERDGDEGISVRVDVVEVTNYLGVPAHITAYASDGTSLATAQDSGWGQTELKLRVAETFDGYLEIEPDTRGFGKQLTYGGPVFRATRSVSVVFPDNAQLPSPQPGTAAIAILAFDCLGIPAPGVTFELEQAVGQHWYTTNRTLPARDATQTELRGSGGISDIPATYDRVMLFAKRNDGKIVAQKLIRVRPDWLTLVILPPRTVDE